MRAPEAKELLEDIEDWFMKRGLPINIRDAGNEEVAKHMLKIMKPMIHIDEPIGTEPGPKYDFCPRCHGVIGESAYYCKKCGAYIREAPKK